MASRRTSTQLARRRARDARQASQGPEPFPPASEFAFAAPPAAPVGQVTQVQVTQVKGRRCPAPTRHSRKCTICNHRERAAIDAAFFHWENPKIIARWFRLADWRCIYRHGHATGLYDQRRQNLRSSLEGIIERAGEVDAAGAVIQAIRMCACLNDSGQRVEPARRVRDASVSAAFLIDSRD